MRQLLALGLVLTVIAFAFHSVDAQRGKGRKRFPKLKVLDLKPTGKYEVYSLLPGDGEQPRLGVTDDFAYRLVAYSKESGTLKFVTYSFDDEQTAYVNIKLPSGAPQFSGMPRMSYDGGELCVVSYQAATLFVNVKTKKVKVAAGIDPGVPTKKKKPAKKKKRGKKPPPSRSSNKYRIHGGGGGRFALSVRIKYDAKGRSYSSSNATLHGVDDKSVELKWSHNSYGLPPRTRDAVFAVLEDEVVVLVTKPKRAGDFSGSTTLTCLVFDRKDGKLKEAQTSPKPWAGNDAPTFMLSPGGEYLVAHPEDSMQRFIVKRGSWERIYKTSYHDPCVGFAPGGEIGVFLETHESDSTQRAALVARTLSDGEEVWRTSVAHNEVQGEGEAEPFTSVGPGARRVATRHGIISGKSSDEAEYIYRGGGESFEPLCMAYDDAGKRVAVVSLGRMFIIDARSREELISIAFEKPLPKFSIGEFVAFDKKGNRVLACVRNQGVWLFDLAQETIIKTLPALKGTWARPLPDLSGVVYSKSKQEGGNVMLQPLSGEKPKRIYRCEYGDTQAVCFWISAKADLFLIAEREVGVGRLFLIDEDGKKKVSYNVKGEDPIYVGDKTLAAFVTRSKQAVLINEIQIRRYTGINCTVINAGDGTAIQKNFSAVFESNDLPGRSTYGNTSASPFFGARHAGSDKSFLYACPAGVLAVDLGKKTFTLHAWSRSPKGLAALNPKGKEFFVAGRNGLTTYKIK